MLADGVIIKDTTSGIFTGTLSTLEVAGFPVGQVSFEVTIQYTESPGAGDQINVGPLEDSGIPFTNHCQPGEGPPFTAVAVKVTGVPEQIVSVPEEETIVTLTGISGFTVMVMIFDVSGLPAVQVSLENSRHEILSWSSGTRE